MSELESETTATPIELESDELLHILGHDMRQHILRYLDNYDGQIVTIDELATHIANDTDQSEDSARIALTQNHLHKLHHAGIISYSQEFYAIEITGPISEVVEIIDAADLLTK